MRLWELPVVFVEFPWIATPMNPELTSMYKRELKDLSLTININGSCKIKELTFHIINISFVCYAAFMSSHYNEMLTSRCF